MKAYRESRGTAPLTSNLGARWKWLVNITLRPIYSPKRSRVPIEYEARCDPEPVWTARIRAPDRPVPSLATIQATIARLPPHTGDNFLYFKLSNLHNRQGRAERWKFVRIRREGRKMPASVESNKQHTTSLCRFKPSAGWSKWSRSYVLVAKQGCVMHYELVTCETRMYNYSFIFVTVF